MITKVECVIIECDNCKDVYRSYSGFSIFPDKSDANDNAMDDEWHREGDLHYCPKCYKINDEDELVVDENRKDIHEQNNKTEKS